MAGGSGRKGGAGIKNDKELSFVRAIEEGGGEHNFLREKPFPKPCVSKGQQDHEPASRDLHFSRETRVMDVFSLCGCEGVVCKIQCRKKVAVPSSFHRALSRLVRDDLATGLAWGWPEVRGCFQGTQVSHRSCGPAGSQAGSPPEEERR